MSVHVYIPGRMGREPMDSHRCRAWSVGRKGQCVNRPTGKVQNVPLCGVHRRLANKFGLAVTPARFLFERKDDPPTIGKDITHLLAPRKKKDK